MDVLYLFVLYLFMFSFLGFLRGWVKEIILTFAIIMALALNILLQKYIPLVRDLAFDSPSLFWIRMIIMLSMVYFGYRTVIDIPEMSMKAGSRNIKSVRDKFFSLFIGSLNGYLLAGTTLFYMFQTNSMLDRIVKNPINESAYQTIQNVMLYMPPRIFGEPLIYFTVIIIFVFVLYIYV